ncbi:DUF6468 domain-containing protein [Telmatospirillum sp. J64-1]|uniref:DUF6468 domain-containing protein n=1 Tax=Telmatospirillum sp. J64-1 TaxID=2502183 RepID=UPI00115DFE69|nr:DUF6468 domain-containing protein [Telmatospirillum sp. J64-1]
MDFKLLLDVVIAVLLAATIAYAVMLNKQLQALRKNRDDMAKIINNFNDATLRAESSIPKLRKAAEEAGQGLQERVEKAQTLRDDLAFMIERADSMANKLEQSVREARAEVKTPSVPPSLAAAAVARARSAVSAGAAAAPAAGSAVVANAAANAAPDFTVEDERSEAERELLRALQSLR